MEVDLHVRLRGLQPGAHAEPDAQRSSDVVSPGRSVFERRWNASFGRLVARKITSQVLENSGITQTNLEISRSARFFSGLLECIACSLGDFLPLHLGVSASSLVGIGF